LKVIILLCFLVPPPFNILHSTAELKDCQTK
jgi:hypothetical protein